MDTHIWKVEQSYHQKQGNMIELCHINTTKEQSSTKLQVIEIEDVHIWIYSIDKHCHLENIT